MDSKLTQFLQFLNLQDYIQSFEKNKVLTLEKLIQMKKFPTLFADLIEPVGDRLTLMEALEKDVEVESCVLGSVMVPCESDYRFPEVVHVTDNQLDIFNKGLVVNISPKGTCSASTVSGESQVVPTVDVDTHSHLELDGVPIADVSDCDSFSTNIKKRKSNYCSNGKPKRVREWIATKEVAKINVHDLLKSCLQGKSVLQYYQKQGVLNVSARTRVVHIIGDALLNVTERPQEADYECVEKQILQLFPSESKGVYFIKRAANSRTKNHEGKLPNYIRNTKSRSRKLEKTGAIVSARDEDSSSNSEEEFQEESADVQNSLGWLKDNLEPWDEVKARWALTSNYRRKLLQSVNDGVTLCDYYDEYKVLRLVRGYELLEIDFKKQHGVAEAITDNWELKRNALFKLLCIEATSAECKEYLGTFASLTDAEKDNFIIQSIPELFPTQPQRKTTSKSGLARIQPRSTKAEVKDSFVLHVTCPNDIDPAITRRREQMKKGGTLQPFVIAVGPTREKILRSYCIVDNIKYDFWDIKKALDICFKATFALNASYASESHLVWLFVQKALFNINLGIDRRSSLVSSLVGNFQVLLKREKDN